MLAALAAYDEALQHYRPDTAPLDYAVTQNNRATLLSEMRGCLGKIGGRACWRRWRRMTRRCSSGGRTQRRSAYAATQNNRATLLSEMRGCLGKIGGGRLLQALQCVWEAYGIVTMEHTPYQGVAERVLRDLRTEVWRRLCRDVGGGWVGA